MKTRHTCKNCSTQLQARQKFCGVCGALSDSSEEIIVTIECETHPDRCAVGLCVVCGRSVCSECEVKSGEKILCANPEHRNLLQEWTVLHRPASEFEADALVRNLADGGIDAKSFSLHHYAATFWLNESRVLLFVRNSESEKAKALLEELNLIAHS
ncbi:MAG: hypothetical protein NTX44_13080 [Ignavibacteriales bacterium]|nr:hypothetical protein [Ignavibacteriales bacterium]